MRYLLFLFLTLLTACSKTGDLKDMPGVIDPSKPINVSPEGVAQLVWSNSNIMAANVELDTEASVVGYLQNKGDGESKVIDLTWINNESSLWIESSLDNCSGKILQSQEICQVTFKFKPTVEGIKNRTIKVNGQLATDLTVWGSTQPENPDIAQFSVTPNSFDFGAVLVDNSATVDIVVENTGGINLVNGSVSLPANANFAINSNSCLAQLNLNSQCTIKIEYTPTNSGNHGAILEVKYSGKTKIVNLIAHGLTPVAGNPVANDLSFSTNEDNSYTGQLTGSDPQGRSLTYTLVSPASKGSFNLNNDGSFTYAPNSNYAGADTVIFKVTNTSGLISNLAQVSINVSPINDAPLAMGQNISLERNQGGVIFISATDVENSPLTYTVINQPSNGVLTGTLPNITYTPNNNYVGSDSFSYKVNDGSIDSNVATINVTISFNNQAPVVTNETYTVDEDQILNDALTGTDANSDSLTFAVVNQPGHGTLSLSANGSFSYQPDPNYSGSDFFTYKASDGNSDSNVSLVTITINPLNDLPVANDSSISVAEDTFYTGNLTATDADNNNLIYSVVTQGGKGSVVINNSSNGSFTYTPSANATGSDRFTFKVNDGVGDSQIATINVSITGVNDAPFINDFSFSTNEDTVYHGTLTALDYENDSMTYSVVSQGTKGTLLITNNQLGTFSYTPNLNQHGSDVVIVKVFDGLAYSANAQISITINPINDTPVANTQSISVTEDNSYSGILTGSDVDGDTLSYSLLTQGAKGTVVITNSATGSFSYTPNSNDQGADSFTFQINDGSVNSLPATVSVNISPVNDAPVANNHSFSTNEDQSLSAQLVVTDVENDSLTYEVISEPTKGSVTINSSGQINYIPLINENGSDTFTYRATDGNLNSNTATVSITINDIQDSPVSSNGSYNTQQNTAIAVTLNATDVDGDVLTYQITQNPTKGVLSGSNGHYTYTPNNLEIGLDVIKFKVNDGNSDSNESTVNINILDNGNWHLAGWNNRSKIHINNSTQGALANMPVLVRLNSSRINYSHTKAGGADLRFVDQVGNSLNYEIEKWNSAGESLVWVKLAQVTANSSSDFIWMYVGNTNATDNQNPSGVWSNGYLAVYHLNNDGENSVSNNLDLTMQGSVDYSSITKVGVGNRFTSSSSYLYKSDDSLYNINNVTIEAWIYEEARVTNAVIADKSTQFALKSNSGKIKLEAAGISVEGASGTEIPLNQWSYVVGAFDTTANTCKTYTNGVNRGNGTCNNNLAASLNNFNVGSAGGSAGFRGSMDEVRISSVARSADWIQAQYLSVNDSYLFFGSEQTYGGTILKSQLATIDNTLNDGEVSEASSRLYNQNIIRQGNDFSCILVLCADYNNWGYYRFQLNQNIPNGATVSNAVIKLYGQDSASWSLSANALKVYLQNSGNSAQVSANNQCPSCTTALPVVSQTINWITGSGLFWAANEWNLSPNMSLMFNNLINNQSGLTSGNYIQIWTTRSSVYGNNKIEVGSQDYSHEDFNQAQILIEWTE